MDLLVVVSNGANDHVSKGSAVASDGTSAIDLTVIVHFYNIFVLATGIIFVVKKNKKTYFNRGYWNCPIHADTF